MRTLIYRSFGDPSVLQWVKTGPNHVLVKCIAGSVNPKDVLLRKGKFSQTLARDPLPRVAGLDIAGKVVEIGADVVDLVTGDLIFGITNKFSGGVHSEYAAFEASEIARAGSVKLSGDSSLYRHK